MFEKFEIVCDACGKHQIIYGEKSLNEFLENWIFGINYDICPDCLEKPLPIEALTKVRAENRFYTQKFKI